MFENVQVIVKQIILDQLCLSMFEFEFQTDVLVFRYFTNIFAEALVPLNPCRWPAFAGGSTMVNDMPEFEDKIQTPFNSLIVAKESFETSLCDVQWRYRL